MTKGKKKREREISTHALGHDSKTRKAEKLDNYSRVITFHFFRTFNYIIQIFLCVGSYGVNETCLFKSIQTGFDSFFSVRDAIR